MLLPRNGWTRVADRSTVGFDEAANIKRGSKRGYRKCLDRHNRPSFFYSFFIRPDRRSFVPPFRNPDLERYALRSSPTPQRALITN
jgi:hypothetical protein